MSLRYGGRGCVARPWFVALKTKVQALPEEVEVNGADYDYTSGFELVQMLLGEVELETETSSALNEVKN
jgi:hypothetical protein